MCIHPEDESYLVIEAALLLSLPWIRSTPTLFNTAREALAAAPPRGTVVALHKERGKIRQILWTAPGDEHRGRAAEAITIPLALADAALASLEAE